MRIRRLRVGFDVLFQTRQGLLWIVVLHVGHCQKDVNVGIGRVQLNGLQKVTNALMRGFGLEKKFSPLHVFDMGWFWHSSLLRADYNRSARRWFGVTLWLLVK